MSSSLINEKPNFKKAYKTYSDIEAYKQKAYFYSRLVDIGIDKNLNAKQREKKYREFLEEFHEYFKKDDFPQLRTILKFFIDRLCFLEKDSSHYQLMFDTEKTINEIQERNLNDLEEEVQRLRLHKDSERLIGRIQGGEDMINQYHSELAQKIARTKRIGRRAQTILRKSSNQTANELKIRNNLLRLNQE